MNNLIHLHEKCILLLSKINKLRCEHEAVLKNRAYDVQHDYLNRDKIMASYENGLAKLEVDLFKSKFEYETTLGFIKTNS